MKAKNHFVDNRIISLSNGHIIGVSKSLFQMNASSSGHGTVKSVAQILLQFTLNLSLKDTAFV